MALISGCCSAEIWLANAMTSGSVEWSGTMADNSTACSWCGIMLVAKATSSALKPAGCPVMTGSSCRVVGVAVREFAWLEHEDRNNAAAMAANDGGDASGARRHDITVPDTPPGYAITVWPGETPKAY